MQTKRKTVTAMDIVYALKRQGRTLYASEVKSLIESRQQHLKGLFQDHEFYWNLIKHFDAIRTIHFESKAQVCESKGQFSDLSDTLLIGVLQFLKNDWFWKACIVFFQKSNIHFGFSNWTT